LHVFWHSWRGQRHWAVALWSNTVSFLNTYKLHSNTLDQHFRGKQAENFSRILWCFIYFDPAGQNSGVLGKVKQWGSGGTALHCLEFTTRWRLSSSWPHCVTLEMQHRWAQRSLETMVKSNISGLARHWIPTPDI